MPSYWPRPPKRRTRLRTTSLGYTTSGFLFVLLTSMPDQYLKPTCCGSVSCSGRRPRQLLSSPTRCRVPAVGPCPTCFRTTCCAPASQAAEAAETARQGSVTTTGTGFDQTRFAQTGMGQILCALFHGVDSSVRQHFSHVCSQFSAARSLGQVTPNTHLLY